MVGSCRALEIAFVFGASGSAQAELVLGGPAGPELWASPMRCRTRVAFARSGTPSHRGALLWPAGDSEVRGVMRLDLVREVLTDQSGAERERWEGVL